MEHKTYTFDKETFQRAFDRVYAVNFSEEQKLRKYKEEQKSVDEAVDEEMKTTGCSRNEAVMKLYPNG